MSSRVKENIRSRVKENITNVLALLLQILAPTKYHYWFALLLDPRYVMELADIKSFHQSKNIDTKVLVQQMMPKFYEYIMDVELAVHPNTPHILVCNNEDYLYFNNNPNRMHSILSEAILLVTKHLDTMVEERGNSPDAENLRSNLLEVHSKMRSRVKENITNVLVPMLQIPAPTKYHYFSEKQ